MIARVMLMLPTSRTQKPSSYITQLRSKNLKWVPSGEDRNSSIASVMFMILCPFCSVADVADVADALGNFISRNSLSLQDT